MRCALLAAVVLLAAAPAAAPAAGNPWRHRPPLNIAHQGGEDEFPSSTMYAFRRAIASGADMLELDIGVTKDDQVVVIHDTTVDSKTNGHGTVRSHALRELRRLDAAYWFAGGSDAYRHDRPRSAYRLRGAATGRRRPPRGFSAADFRILTLREVLRAFPHTPIGIEIKARTKAETKEEYVANAEVLARLLRATRRRDLVVASFQQAAVTRFHELVPAIALSPGVDGSAQWLLASGSPGAGIRVFQLPVTYRLGETLLDVTTAANVARAHREGYAWYPWLSDDPDTPDTWRRLIAWGVDGINTARPRALERVLRAGRD